MIFSQLLWRLAPGLLHHVRSLRVRRKVNEFNRAVGIDRAVRVADDLFDRTVQDGPFRGMRYIPVSPGTTRLSKLIGSYEHEIVADVEQLCSEQHRVIVDVGSAEGYYAVGFAMRCPDSVVYAFDIDPYARRLCGALAQLNGVAERVRVRGACTPQNLEQLLEDRALVVCDCEGYEDVLLDPAIVPRLRRAVILLETHEELAPGSVGRIVARFSPTHDIRTIDVQSRDPSQFPHAMRLPPEFRQVAMDEHRASPQSWLIMQPREARTA